MTDTNKPAPVRPGLAARAREMMLRATGQWTPQTKWNTQYAQGQWEYLSRLDERARYSILAGYAHALKPHGTLLDVGCGEGILRARLHPDAYSRYVGVDFGEAIGKATHLVDERTSFIDADMHDFTPDDTFDTIVFNESMNYFRDPAEGLWRYVSFLAPHGVLLTSTHITPRTDEMWRNMRDRYDVIDEVFVANRDGTSWICRAMRAVGTS